MWRIHNSIDIERQSYAGEDLIHRQLRVTEEMVWTVERLAGLSSWPTTGLEHKQCSFYYIILCSYKNTLCPYTLWIIKKTTPLYIRAHVWRTLTDFRNSFSIVFSKASAICRFLCIRFITSKYCNKRAIVMFEINAYWLIDWLLHCTCILMREINKQTNKQCIELLMLPIGRLFHILTTRFVKQYFWDRISHAISVIFCHFLWLNMNILMV